VKQGFGASALPANQRPMDMDIIDIHLASTKVHFKSPVTATPYGVVCDSESVVSSLIMFPNIT
jgi:hypothetical protein